MKRRDLIRYVEKNGCAFLHEGGDHTDYVNETSYRLGRRAVREAGGPVDGLYLPCAKWPTVDNISALERDTHVPVVTSIQAMMWYCLRRVGLRDRIEGFGKLFEIEDA